MFDLQIDLKICAKSQSRVRADEIQREQFFVKLQSEVLNLCHLTTFILPYHNFFDGFA